MNPSSGSRTPVETMSGSRDETLFLPGEKVADGTRRPLESRAELSLPPDLRRKATQRLRITALSYAGAFFFADLFPLILMGDLAHRFGEVSRWLPAVASITVGILVALVTSSPRLSWESRVNLGLIFEVVGSYGIAISMYLQLPEFPMSSHLLHMLSPSWVPIWVIFYSVLVPAPPRRALAAQVLSVSAPPVVVAYTLHRSGLSHLLPPLEFFFTLVFPHMIAVGLAYVGSRVVYQLGKDVTRARELGSYRLDERLGHGGMGEVWKASHRLLARPAAIKFIRPETIAGSNPEEARLLLRRFELEARATALLTSTHTVALYDFGVTDDGTFYYVMELLEGLDLDRLVRRFGPIPPARLVHVLAQVCESLDEAHAKGLIHRDVKPANIYVCRTGNRCDFVKVLDFGLVSRSRHGELDTRLTLPQQAAGTPAFMAPEQARGETIDGRTDLYALGCVAYWLATGRPVFEGTSAYDLVSQHLHVAPEPPSRHVPGFPAELDQVILECLEKSPAGRPADARDLARRLRSVPLRDRWGNDEAESWWALNLDGGVAADQAVDAVRP